MGHPDLAIIINGMAFIIKGHESNGNREKAVTMAIQRFNQYYENYKSVAEHPEEVFYEINEIKIYEVIG